MANIRDAFKVKLIKILEESTGFSGGDFEFNMKSLGSLDIKYSVKNKFNRDIDFEFILSCQKETFKSTETDFIGNYKEKKAYSFQVTMRPGELLDMDTSICNGETALYKEFIEWSGRAWEEFEASSVIKRLEIQEDKIEELSKKMGDMGNEYFTVEEAEKLKSSLEELKRILQEHIESSEVNDDEKNKELEKINNNIKVLTNNLVSLNKRNWFSIFYDRFSPMKLDPEKRKKILQMGGKGLGMLIEGQTGDSTVKEFIDEITK